MLKKSASFVLAALGASTYRTEYTRIASSLAAAALDSLFDHPAGCSDAVPDLLECCVAPMPEGFFNNLLGVTTDRAWDRGRRSPLAPLDDLPEAVPH